MAQPTIEIGEQELVRRMLENDNRAWGEFVRRYECLIRAAIHRILARYSQSSSRVESEEVYAALLSSLLDRGMYKLRAFEFERGYKLSTWLTMLATHTTWDHLRVSVRRRQLLQALARGEPGTNNHDAMAPVLERESCSHFAKLCSGLSARDREFMHLLYVTRASHDEIARAMGISRKTVYTKKHKVRSRLESALKSPD